MRTPRPIAVFTALLLVAACTGEGEITPPAEAGDEEQPTSDEGEEIVVEQAWEDTPEGQAVVADAIAVVEAYMAARNAYDVDLAQQLVSEDFRTTEYPHGYSDRETLERAFGNHRAYGFNFEEVDCYLWAARQDEVRVTCDHLWTTHLHRIGDYPPTTASHSFVVADGEITRVMRGAGEFQSWWNPWASFLQSEHPEFRRVVEGALALGPGATEELVERLPEYLALYEAWVADQES